jgi:hypothetical protein
MGRSFNELLYVDGFAGPGVYEGGEMGSPIIALRAALLHRAFATGPPKAQLQSRPCPPFLRSFRFPRRCSR